MQSTPGVGISNGVDVLRPFLEKFSVDASVRREAIAMIDGVLSCQEDLDATIRAAADRWKLERIAAIDRAILRLAVFEILESPDVPPKVAINEAIELAKRYSTAQSGAFVNGILDRVMRDEAAGVSVRVSRPVAAANSTESPESPVDQGADDAGEVVPEEGSAG
jgi:N utilization substance protein B